VKRGTRGEDGSAVARNDRVGEIVIDIAVEDFRPPAREREAKDVVVAGGFRERGDDDDDDVLSGALQPAVIRDYSVLVVNVERVGVFSPQSG
jgi:hypothetical protein